MAGISSVIELRDKFSGTAIKYRTLVDKCSQSTRKLGLVAAKQAITNDKFANTIVNASNVTSLLAQNQDKLQSGLGVIDRYVDKIVGKGDTIGTILDTSIKLLKIASLFFSPLRFVVRGLETIRDLLDNGLDKVEFSQEKLHDIVNRLPEIARKIEKAVKWMVFTRTVIASIKKSIGYILLISGGIVATWLAFTKVQIRSLTNIFSISKELKFNAGLMKEVAKYYLTVAKTKLSNPAETMKELKFNAGLMKDFAKYYLMIGKEKLSQSLPRIKEMASSYIKLAKVNLKSLVPDTKSLKTNALIGKEVAKYYLTVAKTKLSNPAETMKELKFNAGLMKDFAKYYLMIGKEKAADKIKSMGASLKSLMPNILPTRQLKTIEGKLSSMLIQVQRKAIRGFYWGEFFVGEAKKAFMSLASVIGQKLQPVKKESLRIFGIIKKEAIASKGDYAKIFRNIKNSAGEMWLSYQINAASNKKTIKQQVIADVKDAGVASVKSLFGLGQNAAKALFAGFSLYRSARGFIKGLQRWKMAYDKLSEATEFLIEQTRGLELQMKRIMTFGEEGAKAIGVYARKYAEITGQSATDIANVAQKMRRSGLGGKQIMDYMGIADMFEKLGDNISFEQAGEAIANAVYNGTTDELESLLGGGERVERLFRKARISRLLRKGDVNEAMSRFMNIAKGMGYTQEALDKVNQGFPAKLQRTKRMLEGYASVVKGEFLKRVEPFIDELMEFLKSKEFQGYFQQTLKKVLAIADGLGKIALFIVRTGRQIYQWWIEPSAGVIRLIAMFIGLVGIMVKLKSVMMLFAGSAGVFGTLTRYLIGFGKANIVVFGTLFKSFLIPFGKATLTLFGNIFKSIFVQTTAAAAHMKKSFASSLAGIKATAIAGLKSVGKAFLASPILWVPLLIIGIGKGIQKLVSELKGETVDVITSVIEFFVGGLFYGYGKFVQIYRKMDNFLNEFWYSIYNGIISILESIGNVVLNKINSVKMLFIKLKMFWKKLMFDFQNIWFKFLENIAGSSLFDAIAKIFGVENAQQKIIDEMSATQKRKDDYLREYMDAMEEEKKTFAELNGAPVKSAISSWHVDFKPKSVPSDKDIQQATERAVNAALDNKVVNYLRKGVEWGRDFIGLGDVNYNEMETAVSALEGIESNTGSLVRMGQRERDLRWMKEMAEQRFINEVNLRQLTPTIKVEVAGSESSADEIAATLERKLSRMASMGTFNAYGDVG